MDEILKRYYQKEEEFLNVFPNVGSKASTFLGDAWSPDFDCDDGTRKNREYFLSTGELEALVFDGAAVYHKDNRFSSAQIVLKSSKRVVTVKVKLENGDLVAEKLVDRKQN